MTLKPLTGGVRYLPLQLATDVVTVGCLQHTSCRIVKAVLACLNVIQYFYNLQTQSTSNLPNVKMHTATDAVKRSSLTVQPGPSVTSLAL